MNSKVKVSIVIPTLNSGKTLRECLGAIRNQDFGKSGYEIVIADAGSSDDTLDIAREFEVETIVDNPLKTGEAGKTAGIKAATGDIIALVDSDNILPSPDWLSKMVEPFSDPEIVASEPIEYTWRKDDASLTRYFALLGMNDPICLFTKNYDRISRITGKWTGLDVEARDCGGYLKLRLTPDALPTIGANGFLFRRRMLEGCNWDPYLFDIDMVHQSVVSGKGTIAKVKTGIVHLYCSRFADFKMKQARRIRDFLFFAQAKQRSYPWNKQRKAGIVLFCLSTLSVVPLFLQMVKGMMRKPDAAWLYHIPVCWVTLWIYSANTLLKMLGFKLKPADRSSWQKR